MCMKQIQQCRAGLPSTLHQPLPPSRPPSTSPSQPYTLTTISTNHFPPPATNSISPLYDILDQASMSNTGGSTSPEPPPSTPIFDPLRPALSIVQRHFSLPHTPDFVDSGTTQ
eukprot:TRINITY_DN27612_c0_g1_i1.p2 TRINITY_DN27612_c0_g1~~TRINITY_DN27612_c0_g1_i1.p2  ORF type:complete len:113 (-),score=35.67 TRINITY_DN27612_c0_g1_i1:177-515(-)